MEAAAALQSAAKPGSVLVGRRRRPPLTAFSSGGLSIKLRSTADASRWKPSTWCGRRPVALAFGANGGSQGPPAWWAVKQNSRRWTTRLRQATSGTGSVVFVVGEPGLGKTRLVQECRRRFMAWVGAGTGRLPLWLEGRCASYASSTPYGLYQQLLSAWTGVAPEEGEEVVGAALERAVQTIFCGDIDDVALLARLMGVRVSGEPASVARLSPEGLQRATFASVKALVAKLTDKGPTVLVLEDLHWADPTSLRLTEELASLVGAAPLLLIATRRPEPDSGVSALESTLKGGSPCSYRSLRLSPLDADAERELAEGILGGNPGRQVVQAVRGNVDGNPLFLEERFLSLVETGALVKRGLRVAQDTPL